MVSPEPVDRLVCQILGDLDSARGSEAVTRLRTSIGIRVEGYIGECECCGCCVMYGAFVVNLADLFSDDQHLL
jgi:hypothetical protein